MGHLGENMQQNTCISTVEARKTIKGWGVSQKKSFFSKSTTYYTNCPAAREGQWGDFRLFFSVKYI